MYLTIKMNLILDEETSKLFEAYGKIYHRELETLINRYEKANGVFFIEYREISNEISFHSKEQLLRLAQKFYEIRKTHVQAEFHRLFVLSHLSFQMDYDKIVMEFGRGFKKEPVTCVPVWNDYQRSMVKNGALLRMDVKKESQQYVARLIIKPIEPAQQQVIEEKAMGVDLGMKCPAVCYTENHKVKFIGNGREIKYQSRKINQRYRKLQKTGSQKRLEKEAHKLHNYKNYIDHCVSREIVEFAKREGITIIRLEKLLNLQQKFYRHDQMCWSYQRVSQYIEYKAKLAGIQVEYVDPFLTTKRCPSCGKINNVKGRDYQCSCGFRKHRDLVGAMNILYAPKV